MARRWPSHVLLILTLVAFLCSLTPSPSLLAQKEVQVSPQAAAQQTLAVAQHYAAHVSSNGVGDAVLSSPVMFVENAGQWDHGARFQVRGN